MSKTPDDWLEENADRLGDALELPGPDTALRTRVLGSTTAHIRRRRQRGLFMQAAALVLAFVTGMAAMSALQNRIEDAGERTHPAMSESAIPEAPDDEKASPEFNHALLADPEAFTLCYQQAGADERVRLLRAAGDYYFYREGDIDLAADFYRRYIEMADAENKERSFDSSNWLLTAMSLNDREDLQNEHEI